MLRDFIAVADGGNSEGTETRAVPECRNRQIAGKYISGVSIQELAAEYYLTEKSIQRIIRNHKQLLLPESRKKHEPASCRVLWQ